MCFIDVDHKFQVVDNPFDISLHHGRSFLEILIEETKAMLILTQVSRDIQGG